MKIHNKTQQNHLILNPEIGQQMASKQNTICSNETEQNCLIHTSKMTIVVVYDKGRNLVML